MAVYIFLFISVIVLVPMLLYVAYQHVVFFYNSYWRDYYEEFVELLEKDGVECLQYHYPRKEDSDRSPFKKPPFVSLSFYFNGYIRQIHKTHFIVLGKKNEEMLEYWAEVTCVPFQEPQIDIKPAKYVGDKFFKQYENVVLVKQTCPACGVKLKKEHNVCPGCGLNFV